MFPASDGRARGRRPGSAPAFVVEDDVLMSRLLSEVTEAAGLEALAFTRLSTARRALRERVPAVLVLDDDLPDGRGADLVREMRANPRTRNVRVIFCTGAGSARRREISSLGPVVRKPFDLTEFERVLATVVAD